MDRIRLNIKGLSYSQTQSGAYALVLGEENGERRLPIIIGGFEAQSIAVALEKDVNPPRPLTHDLFKNFADNFQIKVKEVVIHKLQDGVFFSILVCEKDGQDTIFDARTSDAVALAIRFKSPIFTYREILDKAGVILKEGVENSSGKEEKVAEEKKPSPKANPKKGDLSKKTIEELNQLMDQAVRDENYELAASIRDEIDKRQS
tara:strand:- start:3873 stop:4484 length:612 start_codon:yes stop_codon:yes gene_type:complete